MLLNVLITQNGSYVCMSACLVGSARAISSSAVGVRRVRHGVEAAVHATRIYLHNLQPDQAILKLDFKNAFNII